MPGKEFYSPGADSDEILKPTTSTPSSLSNLVSEEEDFEERYWRAKFAYWALESVLLRHDEASCGKHPELTEPVIHRLKLHFYNAVEGSGPDPLISGKVTATIQKLVNEEIQQCLNTVVETSLAMLRISTDPEDKDWYQKIRTASNPVSVVTSMLISKKTNIAEMESQLENLQKEKLQEISKLENEFQEVKEDLHRFVSTVEEQKNSEDLEVKIKALQIEEQSLDTEHEAIQEEIKALANPPDLQNSMAATYKELKEMNDTLREENRVIDEFLKEYDAQPREIKEQLEKLQAINEAINRQKWILQKMQNFDQTTGAASNDDSFVSQSESSF